MEQLHLHSGPLQFMNFLKTCINKSCPGLWKTGLIVTGNSSTRAPAPHRVTTLNTCTQNTPPASSQCVTEPAEVRWGYVAGWWEKRHFFWKVFHDRLPITLPDSLVSNASFSSRSRHKLTHEARAVPQFTPAAEVKIFEGDEKMITVKNRED